MKKTALTRQQHDMLGERLYRIHLEVMNLACDLQFLGKRHRAVTAGLRAENELLRLRSALDDLFYKANPRAFDPAVYFSGSDLKTQHFAESNLDAATELITKTIEQLHEIAALLYRAIPVRSLPCKKIENAVHRLEEMRLRVGDYIDDHKLEGVGP